MVPILILAAITTGQLLTADPVPGAPFYTADSITNTASAASGSYAPNTFITITGQNLAYVTRVITASDVTANRLPTALVGTGVRVLINALSAYVWSVSPTQVTVLIPSFWTPGPVAVQLELNGIAGPEVQMMLNATAPGLFSYPGGTTVIAQHMDYSAITADAPAQDGELIVLYAGGLGPTSPASDQIPQAPAELADKNNFYVLLDGLPVDPSLIEYVGVTPAYAGLYWINLRLPIGVSPQPEIRISTADAISPGQRYLVLQ